jgi:uncharacterized protein YraI
MSDAITTDASQPNLSAVVAPRLAGWGLLVFLMAATLLAAAAQAGNAYTQGQVHLRAGPSSDYPLVLSIPPNSLLNVNGCLDDFTWCDVDWEGNRGWVYGNYLYYDYQDRRVPVLQFGATLGIGIVSFSIGDYWGRYYTGRPWYARENYWMHRPPPPRRPRPPPPGHGRPPPRPAPPRPSPPPRPAPPPRPQPPVARPQPPRPRPQPNRPSPGQPAPGRPGGPDSGRPTPDRPGGRPDQGRPGADTPKDGPRQTL